MATLFDSFAQLVASAALSTASRAIRAFVLDTGANPAPGCPVTLAKGLVPDVGPVRRGRAGVTACAGIALASFAVAAHAATLTVNSTSDAVNGSDGLCTLREAIVAANGNAASGGVAGECAAGQVSPTVDAIVFAIPGAGVHTISPMSALPALSEPVIIDGYTQAGSSPNTQATGASNAVLQVAIDGAYAGSATPLLRFAAGSAGSEVRGLIVHRAQARALHLAAPVRITGNFIGTDATGVWPEPNESHGIEIAMPGPGMIGGTAPSERNVIAFNGGAGVRVDVAANLWRIVGNRMVANVGKGIALADGALPLANDVLDADTGANAGQNFPLIDSVILTPITVRVQGRIVGAPSRTLVLDIYGTRPPEHPARFLEGELYLGAAPSTIATDAQGKATFDVTLPIASSANLWVTATLTDVTGCFNAACGNTSEFSQRGVFLVTPGRGGAASALPVTVSGQLFQPGASFAFGATPANGVNFVDAQTLTGLLPALNPGTLYDVTVTNPDATTATMARAFVTDFLDVGAGTAFNPFVMDIAAGGITLGCVPGQYCGGAEVSRAAMALFLVRALYGPFFTPPAATGVFADVPLGAFAVAWIEQFYAEGITSGCATNPLRFCPDSAVTRAAMAVFLLRARHGWDYVPPACTGLFADVACAAPKHPFADWIEQLAREGITSGCLVNPLRYCPDTAVLRLQMAVFLSRVFGLAAGANVAPAVNAGADQTITLPATASLAGSATDDGLPNPPGPLTYAWSKLTGPGTVTFGNVDGVASAASFSVDGVYVLRLTVSDGELSGSDDVQVTVNPPAAVALPPDPTTIAPPRIDTAVEPFLPLIEFLWTAIPPIQTGIVPGTIHPVRAAVVRGRVLDRAGAPLSGARVTILRHSELGQTLSRADGRYDLAVNGGGKLIVRVDKAGYFEVQRDVVVPWHDFVHAPDVVLTAPDGAATPVDLSAPTPQVARANPVTDASGTRRATLIVLPGTTAQYRMPDGSLRPAPTNLTVRQTEYTVGALGTTSMPSELPPTSGYTYYLELTADEERVAGAIGVEFSKPVVFYLENFLGFAVGAHAPVGFYDRQAGVWKSEPDGRVVRVVANAGGVVDLDTDGNGTPDNGAGTGQGGSSLGISLAERQALAGLYTTGQSLWRVETPHFSPGDINWPYGPPPDAIPPNGGPPTNEDPRKSPCDCPPCQGSGSIIECGNQTLGESIPVAGTGMSLVYRSDRVPGRREANRIDIPITGATVPASLASTLVQVDVAGQQVRQAFGVATAQSTTFRWDGRDAYGRAVQGAQKARVRVGFEYPSQFQATPEAYYRSWALASGNPTGITGRGLSQIFRDYDVWLGGWDARGQGLGGWSLSAHHVYDHRNRTLYLGSGERRREVDGLAPVVGTIAGNGTPGAPTEGANALQTSIYPQGSAIAIEPDGSVLFFAAISGLRLMRLLPDGTVRRLAGAVNSALPLYDVPAIQANLAFAHSFALGPDGSIYITHASRHVVTRIRPDTLMMELVAGTLNVSGFTGDGGPATGARLSSPRDIAVGSDGSVFVHDAANQRIRRIGPDGIINTIAGNGGMCGGVRPDPQCDDGPALGQKIGLPTSDNSLTVGPDGTLYGFRPAGTFATLYELYKIGTDGVLRVIGGDRDVNPGVPQSTAEGVPALEANFVGASSLAVDREGTVYYAFSYSFSQKTEIRYIDREGRVRILAGSQTGFGGDGGPARSARFAGSPPGIGFGPAGELVIADALNYRLRRLQSRFPGFSGATDLLIPAESGAVVYRFDANGRHLQTLHGLTGAALSTFDYDAGGRLVSITDQDGNAIRVARDASGAPRSITGPFGDVTTLLLDANGWLAGVNGPLGDSVTLAHQANGLLTQYTAPSGQSYTFAYDAATGYLLSDNDPAGGSQALSRTALPPDANRRFGHAVSTQTALGSTKSLRSEWMRNGDWLETATGTTGLSVVTTRSPSGLGSSLHPNGVRADATLGPDPRFGMLAPFIASAQVQMPAVGALSTTTTNTVTLTDPANVFSIGQLTRTTTMNGRTATETYDGATREFTQTSPAGRVARSTIDAFGRPLTAQVQGLAAASYRYDARGRIDQVTVGSGMDARVTTFAYTPQGLVDSITDPVGQTTRFAYDAWGQTLTQTRPDGAVAGFGYDINGNVNAMTPPGQSTHSFSYSPIDLGTQYVPPVVPGVANPATVTTYSADRDTVAVSRPDGLIVTPSYDTGGRLSRVAFSRGSIDYSYDASGMLSRTSAPGGIVTDYRYDGGLLTSTDFVGPVPGRVSHAYDANFRVVSQSINGAMTAALTYDADGLLTGIGQLSIARDPGHGLRTGSTIGGVSDAFTRNTHAEVMSYAVSSLGAPVYRIDFIRDKLGRITRKTEVIQGNTIASDYQYDAAGRLTSATTGGVTSTYTYDANGNRTAFTGQPANIPPTQTQYDAQDRVLRYGTASYTYTANGDLATEATGANTRTFTYDEFANLVRLVLPGGTTIDNLHDAANRRVGKRVNGTLVKGWLYDGPVRILAELDGAGAMISRFVYSGAGTVPEYMVRGGNTYRIVRDHLDSVRLVIDAATGAVAQRMRHDEFGRVLEDTNPGFTPFGFAGGLYDTDTGLVRFGARDYDPSTGRFTTKDPIGLAGGFNVYAYVGNDPVNGRDPFGLLDPSMVIAVLPGNYIFGMGGAFGVYGAEGAQLMVMKVDTWAGGRLVAHLPVIKPWFDAAGYHVADTMIVSGKPYTVRQFSQMMLRRGLLGLRTGSAYAGSAMVGWSIGESINAYRPHPCGPTMGESIQQTLGFNSFWSWYFSTPNPVVSEYDRYTAEFQAADRRMAATDFGSKEKSDAYRRYRNSRRGYGAPEG